MFEPILSIPTKTMALTVAVKGQFDQNLAPAIRQDLLSASVGKSLAIFRAAEPNLIRARWALTVNEEVFVFKQHETWKLTLEYIHPSRVSGYSFLRFARVASEGENTAAAPIEISVTSNFEALDGLKVAAELIQSQLGLALETHEIEADC